MRLYGLNRRKLLAVIVFLRSRTELSHVFPVFREDFDLPVASLLHGLPPLPPALGHLLTHPAGSFPQFTLQHT